MALIPKIGVFPSDLEPLMLFADKRFSLRYLIAKNTAEDSWAKKFLPEKQCRRYQLRTKKTFEDCNFGDILHYSDLAGVIKKNRIKYLWLTVDNEDRRRINHWAKIHGIKIIGPDCIQQKKFEDKIWFDRFLARERLPKPDSQIYRPLHDKLRLAGKFVLQEAASAGSEGTFFIDKPADVAGLLKAKIISAKKKYLARKFVRGLPGGITILVTPDTVALSAIRRQCFSKISAAGRPVFSGIQWLPFRRIKKAEKNINAVFGQLGRIMREQKFFGYANVDFIIEPSGAVKIIECNPRFSSSTAQLAKMPALISGLRAGNKLIADFIGRRPDGKNFKFYPLPKTDFTGCVLDVDALAGAQTAKTAPPIGLYRKIAGQVKYLTPDIRQLNKSNEFIWLTFVSEGEKLSPESTVGLLISNFRLFSETGGVNSAGKKLLKQFNFQ